MTTTRRYAEIAQRYGMDHQIDTPGFVTFIDVTTQAGVKFFWWSNPRLAAQHDGIIPDGYIVIIPFVGHPGDELGRLAVRHRAWPRRGLTQPEWKSVNDAIHRLVGSVLSEPTRQGRIDAIDALDVEDTGSIDVFLLRDPQDG